VTLIKIRSHRRKFSNSDSVEQKKKHYGPERTKLYDCLLPEIINIGLSTIGSRFDFQMKQALASSLLMDVNVSGDRQLQYLAIFLQGYRLVVVQ
jgi:hypothetical protein